MLLNRNFLLFYCFIVLLFYCFIVLLFLFFIWVVLSGVGFGFYLGCFVWGWVWFFSCIRSFSRICFDEYTWFGLDLFLPFFSCLVFGSSIVL